MTENVLKLGVFGASGRMGATVIQVVESVFENQIAILAVIDQKQGKMEDLTSVDAVIDFSLPLGTSNLLDWFEAQTGHLPSYLCGTTGLSDSDHARMQALSHSTNVMYATNFSSGATALSAILKFAAPILKALSYKASVYDTHHIHKIDLPSGTAKAIRDIVDLDGENNVDIHSVKEGEVVGKIDVVFAGVSDQITIGINIEDRGLFAKGAIEAALWLNQIEARTGFYTMDTFLQDQLNRASSNG